MPTLETEIDRTLSPHPAHSTRLQWVQYTRAFAGLMLRDLHVLRREWTPSSSASS